MFRHNQLAPDFARVVIENRDFKLLCFQLFMFRQIPDNKTDRKWIRRLRAGKVRRRKHEAVLKTKLENPVAEFLVVVGIDVFQRGKQTEMSLFVRELFADAEKKLREQKAGSELAAGGAGLASATGIDTFALACMSVEL